MKYGLLFHYWMNDAKEKCDYYAVSKKIHDAGFDVIEIDAIDLLNMSDDEVLKLKAHLDGLGMEVSVNNPTGPHVDPSSSDPEIRKAGVKFLEDVMYKMDKLGSHTLIGGLVSAWPVDWNVDHDKEACTNYAVESLTEAMKTAEKLGICLHIEVLNRYESFMMNDVNDVLSFIDRVGSPNLKVLVDTFHVGIEEDNLPDAIRRLGSHLGHLHLDENNRKLPGLGAWDWAGIGQALRDVNFDGYAVIEPFMLKDHPFGKAVHLFRDFYPNITPAEYDQMLVDSLAFLKKNFEA